MAAPGPAPAAVLLLLPRNVAKKGIPRGAGGGGAPEVDDIHVGLVHRANHPLLRVDPLRHRPEDPRDFHPNKERGTAEITGVRAPQAAHEERKKHRHTTNERQEKQTNNNSASDN